MVHVFLSLFYFNNRWSPSDGSWKPMWPYWTLGSRRQKVNQSNEKCTFYSDCRTDISPQRATSGHKWCWQCSQGTVVITTLLWVTTSLLWCISLKPRGWKECGIRHWYRWNGRHSRLPDFYEVEGIADCLIFTKWESCAVLNRSVVSDSLWPRELSAGSVHGILQASLLELDSLSFP